MNRPMEPARVARIALAQGAVRLSYYAPRLRQEAHEHEEPHVSVILSGSLEEASSRTDGVLASGGMLRIRPRGFRHHTTFGAQGALIVVLPLDAQDDILPSGKLATWCLPAEPTMFRGVLEGLFADAHADPETAVAELAACCLPVQNRVRRLPRWLIRAHEQLSEDPSGSTIGDLARQAAVHRVHFARLFSACFGQPPSVFRRHAMLQHAVRALLHDRCTPAEAALCGGFADQSHFIRTARELIGVSPGRLRSVFC